LALDARLRAGHDALVDTQKCSDVELKAAIIDEFDRAPGLNGDDIRVAVRHGAVTLAGTVATHPERGLAQAAALRVPGVNALAGHPTVATTGSVSDSGIACEASEALSTAIGLPPNLVKAAVTDGWVTLNGQVDTHHERDIAERAVRDLPGVMGLHSAVAICRPVSAVELKSAISDALAYNAELEAARIVVTVESGVVTLDGIVQSWTERQQACATAWSASGVTDVENHLRIAN
jgi:osmotically-inducible protein OsmY